MATHLSRQMEHKQLPCLTGARFVAALLVVLFHYGWLRPLPGIVFDFGQQAVSFFFILSGLVLTFTYRDPIEKGRIGWSGFFNLRLARIVPLHVATWLIATLLYFGFAWRPYQGVHPFVSWIFGLTCLQVFIPTENNLFRWNGQSWSISCELFFYALFPFLLSMLARRLKTVKSLLTTALGVFVAQTILFFGGGEFLWKVLAARHPILNGHYAQRLRDMTLVFPPLRLAEFVIGVCMGLLLLRPGSGIKSARSANLLLAASGVLMLFIKRLPWYRSAPVMTGAEQYLPYVPLMALIIMALASGKTFLTPVLENKSVILLGEASYSLYLLHGFLVPGSYVRFLSAAIPVDGHAPSPGDYVLCVVGSIAASIVFYEFLERPARKMWRRMSSATVQTKTA